MAEGFLPPVVAVMKGNIRDFQAKMGEARGEMDATAQHGGSRFKALGKAAAIGLLAIGTTAVAVGGDSIHMADQYESAHARVVAVAKNTNNGLSTLNRTLGAQESKFTNIGYNSTQYNDALAMLIPATGSVTKAENLMGEAADLAAARHMDLTKAAVMVGKISQGNTTILKRFGIDLGIAAGGATKMRTAQLALATAQTHLSRVTQDIAAHHLKGTAAVRAYQDALTKLKNAQLAVKDAGNAGAMGLSALEKRIKGSAQAQAETFGGKIKILDAKLHNLMTNIGLKLIPVLLWLGDEFVKLWNWIQTTAVPWLEKFGRSVDDKVIVPLTNLYQQVAPKVATVLEVMYRVFVKIGNWLVNTAAPAIAGFAKAFIGQIEKLAAWWSSRWADIKKAAENAFKVIKLMLAPFILAFVVGFKVITMLWNAFGSTLISMGKILFSGVMDVIKGFWSFVKGIFDLILGLASGDWSRAWDGLKQMWSGIWDNIKGIVLKPLEAIVKFFTDLPGNIGKLAMAVYNAAFSIGQKIVDGIINAVKGLGGKLMGYLKHIPGAGIVSNVISHIPGLATGGPAFAGMPYVVGEHGPELFMPEGNGRVIPNNRLGNRVARGGGGRGFGGGGGITIGQASITVVSPDPQQAGLVVMDTLTNPDFLYGRT